MGRCSYGRIIEGRVNDDDDDDGIIAATVVFASVAGTSSSACDGGNSGDSNNVGWADSNGSCWSRQSSMFAELSFEVQAVAARCFVGILFFVMLSRVMILFLVVG